MSQCTIVVPCYNEADRLDVPEFVRFAEKHPNITFVMVNDGSTDRTLDVLKRLEATNDRSFRLLDMPKNSGKAEAVRHGMLHALSEKPDFIGYWDADLSTSLTEIFSLLDAFQTQPDVKLVMGSRVRMLGHRIERGPVRFVLGRAFATAASLVLQLPVFDTQCGAKIFRSGPFLRQIFETPFHTSWVFDVEMLSRLRQTQADSLAATAECIREVPLKAWNEVPGSKVTPTAFVQSFFQLARIAWTYRRIIKEEQPIAEPVILPFAQNDQVESLGSLQSEELKKKSA